MTRLEIMTACERPDGMTVEDELAWALHRMARWPNPQGTIMDAYVPGWLGEVVRGALNRYIDSAPPVIRDRRPTKEEVESAMDGEHSRWILAVEGWVMVYLYQPYPDIGCILYPAMNDLAPVEADGRDAPGHVWRPLAPDGSPMRLP